MTIREYAKKFGHEIVGKLTKQVFTEREYSFYKEAYVDKKTVYWTDEVGNEYYNSKRYAHPFIVTVDGAVI